MYNRFMKIDYEILKNPTSELRGKPFWAWNGEIDEKEIDFQIECLKKMGFGGAFIHSRTGLKTEYMGEKWLKLVRRAAEKLAGHGLEAYLYDEDRWPSGTCGGYVTETKEFRAKYMTYFEVVSDDVARESDNSGNGEDFEKPENFLGLFAVEFDGKAAKNYRKIASPSEKKENERVFAFYFDYMQPDSFYNGYTYADTMNKAATERFIGLTHEKYFEAFGELFGTAIKGIFTDEPHRNPFLNGFGRKEKNAEREIPYTYKLFEEFEKRKGYKIEERLPLLWFGDAENDFCKETYDLIEVEQELFLENFAAPYHKWCRAHGLLVTGHVLHEDNLAAQTTMCGSVMRYYEYMDYPGMDNLCEDNFAVNVPSLVNSVAKQLGKKFVLDELYAATGWKMTLADYKRTGNWQSFGGVSLRCPHLSWYTMKGQAKRDYPASILHQSAWYPEHKYLEDYFSRLQYLLNFGEEQTDVAIINPVESLWGLTNERSYINCFGTTSPLISRLEREYYELFKFIRLNGGTADYIDEGIFAKHGKAENGRLVVGKKRYDKIILNGNYNLRSTTLSALKEFVRDGGTLILAGGLPGYLDGVRHDFSEDLNGAINVGFNPEKVLKLIKSDEVVVSEGNIISETRVFDDGKAYFFLNKADDAKKDDAILSGNRVTIVIKNAVDPVGINLYTGEKFFIPFTRRGDEIFIERNFENDGALVLLCNGEKIKEKKIIEKPTDFPEEFDYKLEEPNVLPLDFADCYLDGEFFARGDVLEIDRKIREKFGLEQRHGEMVQPWFKDKFYPAPENLCKVTLKFSFKAAEPVRGVAFMTEDENAEIRVNGNLVDGKTSHGTEIDGCFRVIPVADEFLKVGKNEITVAFDFNERYDIEGAFLCGDFGVYGDNETEVLKGLPKKLKIGDFAVQGLKYYGGRVSLRSSLKNGVYRLIADDLPCAACVVNGVPAVFPPINAEFEVTKGELLITLAFTRQNTFGTEFKNGVRSGLIPQGLSEKTSLVIIG